jgi:transcriptional regulator with XRE-family HTH domain
MIDSAKICARLDGVRRRCGLSQEQLAARLGVSQPAISKYLKDRVPPADVLLKFAQLSQTTVEWLMCGEKSYLYGEQRVATVREPETGYDSDLQLARDIARLPAEIREAIVMLVRKLAD